MQCSVRLTGDQIWGRRWGSSSGLKEFGFAHGEEGAHRAIKTEEDLCLLKVQLVICRCCLLKLLTVFIEDDLVSFRFYKNGTWKACWK